MFPLQDLSGFLMVYIRCLLKRLGLVFSSVYHETDHASSEAHMTHVTCFSRLPFLCQTDSAAKRPELFQNPGTGSVRFSLAAVGFRLSPVQLWEGMIEKGTLTPLTNRAGGLSVSRLDAISISF